MKTKEELNALKEEAETLNKKLAELSEEELKQIAGGSFRISEQHDNEFGPYRYHNIKTKDDSELG